MHPEVQGQLPWRIASAAVTIVAVLAIIVALVPTGLPQAFAALAVLFLPTYLIAWPVLRPRLGTAGAFTVAGGLSIGVIAMIGLALNVMPAGLQTGSWLAIVVIMLVAGMAIRPRQLAWRPMAGVLARHELFLLGIGASVLVLAYLVARFAASVPTESFTQLWLIPSAASESSVELSVRNEEREPVGYRLEVRRNGAVVRDWEEILLSPGESWTRTVSVGSGRLLARLYLLTDPERVYRHTTLMVGPAP